MIDYIRSIEQSLELLERRLHARITRRVNGALARRVDGAEEHGDVELLGGPCAVRQDARGVETGLFAPETVERSIDGPRFGPQCVGAQPLPALTQCCC